MIILDSPQITYQNLFFTAQDSSEYLPNLSPAYFTRNGRSALFQGLGILTDFIKKEILVPAYNCGIELETVITLGYEPIFYDVDKKCNIDLRQLESLISKNTLGILITHFNGFPQPLEKIKLLCDNYGIFLIEDCAHVLCSYSNGEKLGSIGDIAVFSPRKYLPIQDGGLLIFNNLHLAGKAEENIKKNNKTSMELSSVVNCLKSLLKNILIKYDWYTEKITNKIAAPEDSPKKIELFDFSEDNYDLSMTYLSRFLLMRFDFESIIARRRKNFSYLHEKIQGINGVNDVQGALPQNVCPWVFLLAVDNPWNLRRYLLSQRVLSDVFWSFYHAKFPFTAYENAEYLKSHVLALPVHQDLNLDEMDYMAAKIAEYCR